MKWNIEGAKVRKIDQALQICDLFDGKDFAFDFVVAELDGIHPIVVNHVSDRAYFILNGKGVVFVGDAKHHVKANDLVTIPHGTHHGLEGKLRYVIITSPPFDSKNEEVVG